MPGAPNPPVAVRNLTATRLGVEIPAGESESLTYSFATELHPQDLNLALVMMLQNAENQIFTKVVYNETVSVVEAPVSIFDPQMYVPTVPLIDPTLRVLMVHAASSSTSSWRQPSEAPATSSTAPGLRHCSRRKSVVERVETAPNGPEPPRRPTQRTRQLLSALMDRRQPLVPRHMMRAGFRRSI